MNNDDDINNRIYLPDTFSQATGNQAAANFAYNIMRGGSDNLPLNLRQAVTSPPPLADLRMYQQTIHGSNVSTHSMQQPQSASLSSARSQFIGSESLPLNLRQTMTPDRVSGETYATMLNSFQHQNTTHGRPMSSSSDGRHTFSPHHDDRHAFSPHLEDRQPGVYSPRVEDRRAFSPQVDDRRTAPFSPPNDDRRAFSPNNYTPNTPVITAPQIIPNTQRVTFSPSGFQMNPAIGYDRHVSEYTQQIHSNITQQQQQPSSAQRAQFDPNVAEKRDLVQQENLDLMTHNGISGNGDFSRVKSPSSQVVTVQDIGTDTVQNRQFTTGVTVGNDMVVVGDKETLTASAQHKSSSQKEKVKIMQSASSIIKAARNPVKSEALSYECPVCDTAFDDQIELKNHLAQVHDVHSVLPPDSAGEIDNENDGDDLSEVQPIDITASDFDVFSAKLSGYTKFSCIDCGAEFKNKEKLIVHVRKHSSFSTLLCTICGKSFFKSDKLARHMLVHSGERPYVCRHCGATFTRSDKLRAHLRSRHDDTSYSCRNCRDSFEDIVALKLHLSKHDCRKYRPSENEEQDRKRREREALECSFNEIAAQIGDPEIDIALMLNREKLAASFDASIAQDGELDAVAVKETVLKSLIDADLINNMPPVASEFIDETLIMPFVDPERAKAKLAHEKKLERIIKRINKYRTVACPYCNLKLPGAYTYTRHLRIAHNVVKTYQYQKKERPPKGEGPPAPRIRQKRQAISKFCQCQTCGKSFTKLDTLKRHEVTHTGERAFKCMYCDAKYSRSDRLRKHLRSSHTAAAYPCIKCELVFETKAELRRHIGIHRAKAPKTTIDKPRIRGPYKKRKLKLGTSADSNVKAEGGRSGLTNAVSQSGVEYGFDPISFQQPSNAIIPSADSLAIFPPRPGEPNNAGEIFSTASEDFKLIQRVISLGNNAPVPCDSGVIQENTSLGRPSQTGELDKAVENVFRLSSAQLSTALSLRNNKSGLNVEKNQSSKSHKKLLYPEVKIEVGEEIEEPGVRIKRKYVKHKDRMQKESNENSSVHRKEKIFKCMVCPKKFATRRDVARHERIHQKKKPFSCKHCGSGYTRYDALQSHLQRMHNDRLFSCKRCDEIFPDAPALKDHIMIHKQDEGYEEENEETSAPMKLYKCRQCKKVFDARDELKKHLITHAYKKVHKVFDEDEEEDDGDVKGSVLSKVPIFAAYEDAGLTVCASREKPVNAIGKFKRGRKPGSGFRGITIKQEVDFARIKQERDTGEGTAEASNDMGFDSKDLPLFDKSQKRRRPSDDNGSATISVGSEEADETEDLMDCSECGKRVPGKAALRRHIKVVHTARYHRHKSSHKMVVKLGRKKRRVPHRCGQCGMTFKGIISLRQHMERHEAAARPAYDCLECGATFTSEKRLENHIYARHRPGEGQIKRPYRRKSQQENEESQQDDMASPEFKIEQLSEEMSFEQKQQPVIERNSRGMYQCNMCELSFSMVAKLRRHSSIHTGEKPYQCKRCHQTFARSDKLRVHLKLAHDEHSRSCLFCDEIFESKEELSAHTKNHIEHRNIISANKQFSKANRIDLPLRRRGRPPKDRAPSIAKAAAMTGSDNGGTRALLGSVKMEPIESGFDSTLPEQSFDPSLMDFSLLDDKKLRLTGCFGGDKHLHCPICNKGMSSTHALKRHVTCSHTDERPYVCCDCPKSFSRMDKFRNHLRKHFGFIYPCTVCGETFLRWYHWKKHTLLHTISCELCDYTCVSQTAMNRHISKHTGEKLFVCTHCGKKFWRNYHLQIHTRIHTGQKQFPCTQCDKFFRHNYDLVIHTRIHTGEMPYACDKCGKRFFRSDRLKRHRESHDREGGMLCSTCGKSFTSAIALKVHSHIHDTVLPQVCLLCGAVMATPKEMRKHRKKVHPGETFFTCGMCQRQFHTHAELVVHSAEHFEGENPPEGFSILPDGKIMLKPNSKQPFLCCTCGLQVSSRHALIRHQRVHTGEKNYTCQYCAQQFSTSYGLRRHVERHEKNGGGPLKIKAENSGVEGLEESGTVGEEAKRIGGEGRDNGGDDVVIIRPTHDDIDRAVEELYDTRNINVVPSPFVNQSQDIQTVDTGSTSNVVRQPLDLAKLAISVGINIPEDFSGNRLM